MATVDKVEVEVRAELAKLRPDLNRMTGLFDGAFKQVERSGEVFAGKMRQLGGAVAAYFSVQTVRSIAQTGLAFDRLNIALKAATGSADAGRREFEFIRTETDRLGLSLLGSADAYVKLAAATRGTALEGQKTRDVFTATAEAAAVMKLSAEDTNGALRALEQMASKGVISMEELKLQLGDRIPGTMRIAAQAMNMTTAEFIKMVGEGRVVSEEFLPRFAAQMRKEFAGGVREAADSAAASFARFQNSIDELQNALAQSGLLDALSQAADALTKLVKLLSDNSTASEIYNQALAETKREHEQLHPEQAKTIEGLKKEAQARLDNARAALKAAEALWAEKLANDSRTFGGGVMDYNRDKQLDAVSYEAINKQISERIAEVERLADEMDNLSLSAGKAETTTDKLSKNTGVSKEAIKSAEQLRDALESLHNAVQDDAAKQGMDEIQKELYDYDKAVERLTERLGKLNDEQALRVAIDREVLEGTLKQKKASEEAEKAAEELKKRQEEYREMMEEPFKNALENIQQEFGDTFTNIYMDGIDGAEDFADNMKRIFARLAGELTAMMVIRATLGGVDGGGLGSILSGGAMPGSSSGMGGLSNLSGVGNMMNGFSGGFSAPLFSSTSLVGGGIDKLGAFLGYGGKNGLPWQGLSSNFTAGSALGGFGGNLAADLIFGGDRGAGASVGGMVGGVAGTILGAGNPLASAAGAFLGNAIGGLFGGKEPKDQISAFYTRLNGDMTAKNLEFGSAGMGTDAAKTLSEAILPMFSGLDRQLGLNFNNQRIGGQYSMKNGASLQFYSQDWQQGTGEGYFKNFTFDPKNAEESSLAFAKLTVEMMKNMDAGQDVVTAMKHIQTEGRTAAEIMSDVNFAANFERLGESEKPISALEQKFRELSATAERLGLSTDKVRATMASQFNEDIAKQIQAIVDPAAARTAEINEYFDKMVEDARLIGASINRVEKLRDITLENEGLMEGLRSKEAEAAGALREAVAEAARLASQFEQMQDSLKGTMDSLLFGSNSALNVDDQLAMLRERAFSLNGKTDLDSLAEINSLVPMLTNISRQANATGGEFVSDFELGQALLRQAMTAAGNQAAYQNAQVARGNAALGITTGNGGADVSAAISQLTSIQSQLAREQARLTEALAQNAANDYGRATG